MMLYVQKMIIYIYTELCMNEDQYMCISLSLCIYIYTHMDELNDFTMTSLE